MIVGNAVLGTTYKIRAEGIARVYHIRLGHCAQVRVPYVTRSIEWTPGQGGFLKFGLAIATGRPIQSLRVRDSYAMCVRVQWRGDFLDHNSGIYAAYLLWLLCGTVR